MRFLVDLYRVIILAFLALLLAGGAFIFFLLAFGGYEFESAVALPVLIGGVVMIVVSLGLVATFISIHDRLAEIGAQAERVADRLEVVEIPRAAASE